MAASALVIKATSKRVIKRFSGWEIPRQLADHCPEALLRVLLVELKRKGLPDHGMASRPPIVARASDWRSPPSRLFSSPGERWLSPRQMRRRAPCPTESLHGDPVNLLLTATPIQGDPATAKGYLMAPAAIPLMINRSRKIPTSRSGRTEAKLIAAIDHQAIP